MGVPTAIVGVTATYPCFTPCSDRKDAEPGATTTDVAPTTGSGVVSRGLYRVFLGVGPVDTPGAITPPAPGTMDGAVSVTGLLAVELWRGGLYFSVTGV